LWFIEFKSIETTIKGKNGFYLKLFFVFFVPFVVNPS